MKTLSLIKLIVVFALLITIVGVYNLNSTQPNLSKLQIKSTEITNTDVPRLLIKKQNSNLETATIDTEAKTTSKAKPHIKELGKNYMGISFENETNIGKQASNFTPQAAGTYIDGIDVSIWQGSINWSQVRQSGIRFAFAKSTEGSGYYDPTFNTNINNGTDAKVYIGPYHFARPDLNPDARAEANFFANTIKPYIREGYLRPVLDLEVNAGYSWEELSDWTRVFMKRFKAKTEIEPIIYLSSFYATNLASYLNKYDLWIANWTYNTNASPGLGSWDSWLVWQYSNNGSVPGINARTDLNVFKGNFERMYSLLTVYPYTVDYCNSEGNNCEETRKSLPIIVPGPDYCEPGDPDCGTIGPSPIVD